MASLEVQADGVAAVVRIIAEDSAHELDPDSAEQFGEQLIRAARDVTTEQSTLAASAGDGQATLAESADSDDGGFAHLLDDDGDGEWELGEPINANDPLDW
jgi:hypothetical protein